MAYELSNRAPPGSLLKQARAPKRKKNQPGKRVKDEAHLAFVRKLPCIAGGNGPIDAAHIRQASAEYNKPVAGTSLKPDDCWTIPLTHGLHLGRLHQIGEERFFAELGVNPLKVAWDLFQASGDLEAGRSIIAEARKR